VLVPVLEGAGKKECSKATTAKLLSSVSLVEWIESASALGRLSF
jgi:hypothetical protein